MPALQTYPPHTVPTRHWHKIDDNRIQCDVCPRNCQVQENQRGLCFVRQNMNGEIVLTSYGRSSGFCIDPIEKKPLFHYLPGTSTLSFGTAGCNLTCQFCQNWDISKSREIDTLSSEATPDQIAQAALLHECRSVAFTYNDPVVFMEYAVDVAKACHNVGIKSVAVTAGYMCAEPRREFYQHMDAANVDLKSFTENFYHKICSGHLQPVLDTLVYLKNETNVWFEITTLLVPGENDSPEEIDAETKWIKKNLGPDIPLHFSAFHPDWKMLNIHTTPPVILSRSREIALKNGLHYVYTGNVHNQEGEKTICPQCMAVLIERDWYELTKWNLKDDGRCPHCETKISGLFEKSPGSWGSRRRPISIQK